MNSYLNDNREDKQFFSLDPFSSKAIPLSFVVFRLASNAFADIWSVGLRSDWKKQTKQKSQEVSEQEALVPHDDVMLLLRSFFKIKKLFQVKNGSTTSFLFFSFWKCLKLWVGRTTRKGEKKTMA